MAAMTEEDEEYDSEDDEESSFHFKDVDSDQRQSSKRVLPRSSKYQNSQTTVGS